ncbi:MAG: hypothetical protein R3290_09090 [Acidimicrobiia bacterium]|nr:hypothetical protein [Acidimicrobiia bacterium]
MGWLWLVVGLTIGLLIGTLLGRLRRRRKADAPAPEPTHHAASEDATRREAVWALRQAERRRTRLEGSLAMLQARITEAGTHADRREAEIDDLRDRLGGIVDDVDRTTRERDEAEERVAALETELAAERRRIDAETEAHDAELVRLRAHAERLQAAEETLRRRTREAEHRSADLRRERDMALASIRRLTDERARLRRELAEAAGDAAAAHERAIDARARSLETERARDEAVARAEEAAATVTRLERRIGDLQDGRTADELRLAEMRERVAEAADERDRLRRLTTTLARRQEDDTRELRAADAERVRIADLQQRVRTLAAARRGDVDRLSGELERARRAAVVSDDRAERIAELQRDLAAEGERRIAAEDAAGRLMERAATLEDRVRAAADELRDLDDLRERLARTAEALAESRETIEALSHRSAADEIERLRGALRVERRRSVRLGRRLRDGDEGSAEAEELRLRIAELEDLVARLERSGPDDLTLVRGIGPAIAELLMAEGITTFEDLATIDAATLDRLREIVPVYPGRIERDRWIEQAQTLATRRGRRSHG